MWEGFDGGREKDKKRGWGGVSSPTNSGFKGCARGPGPILTRVRTHEGGEGMGERGGGVGVVVGKVAPERTRVKREGKREEKTGATNSLSAGWSWLA